MTMADVTISCPHCRRQYTMRIDPERLKRLKTRATCGRCGNTFDVASRIVPASEEATTDPKLPRIDVAATPTAQLLPASPSPSPVATIPDLNDEMEELAREFAEAAARFTPIAVKRPAAVLAPTPSPSSTPLPSSTLPSSTQPDLQPPPVEPPPRVITPGPADISRPADAAPSDAALADAALANAALSDAALSDAALADAALSEGDVAAAYDQLSLEAAPAGDDEFAAAIPTQSRARPAPPAPPPPRDWLDLADPGLAALQPPPSAGAAALEALLNESEKIALPNAAS